MYIHKTKIKLHDTDAAGILFFSHQFEFIHDAYECVLEKIGFSFSEIIKKKNFFLPIIHAESDYKAPLYVGDHILIEVRVSHVGETSFAFTYRIVKSNGTLVGTAKTVHVTVDKRTQKKIRLPKLLKDKVSKLYRLDQKSFRK